MRRSEQSKVTLIAILLNAVIIALLLQGIQDAQAAESKSPPARFGLQGERIDNIEKRLQQYIERKIIEKSADSSKEVLERADRAAQSAETLLSVVKWVSSGWIAVVTLMFAAIMFWVWREAAVVSKAATSATESAKNVSVVENQTKASAERVQAMDQSISQAVKDVAVYFEKLPRIERRGLVGALPDLPTAEEILRFEEADIVIVMANKTHALPQADMVEPFTRIGYYWRLVGNFPRAIARFRKAIDLDPNSAEARRGLAGTLYGLAALKETSPTLKARLLDEAEEEIKQLLGVKGREALSLFDLGWIYDERGDYERAVGFYREAQELDRGKHPNITYNLACSYSRWGKYQEALDELRKVIDKDQNWVDAAADKDFERLRNDPGFGPQFSRLIEEERPKH